MHSFQILNSRIRLLLSSLVDFVIINIIFNVYIPNEKIFSIGLKKGFYILFWILISYIFDRYFQNKITNQISVLNYQFLNSLKSIISFGIIFSIYNWALGDYTGRSFLLTLLLNLFIFSSLAINLA